MKKTDEELNQLFEAWTTSWKWLKNKGIIDAKEHGDCIFLKQDFSNITLKDRIKSILIKREQEAREEVLKELDEWMDKISPKCSYCLHDEGWDELKDKFKEKIEQLKKEKGMSKL